MDRRLTFSRIDRYITSQLAVALILVTAGLVALIWLTQSLRFIQVIVNHGLSPFVFIKLTLLLVPSFVATILPITCFIVVLFIYSRLSGDRELTVMRAAGMSDYALARPALMVALLATFCGYGLNIVLVPVSLNVFRTYQYEIRNQIAAFLLEPGVFTNVADGLTVYVQSRGPHDSLQGIMIHDEHDDYKDPTTILARSGQLESGANGPMVLLEDGQREQIDPKTGQLDILTFERNIVSLVEANKTQNPDDTDSAEVPIDQLFHPPTSLTAAQQAKWLVEGQRRLTAPLTTLSYTFIALLAVLTGMFRRHGGLLRPFAAIATVTLLVALSLGVNNLAARNSSLLPLIWFTVLAPGLAAAMLLILPRRPGR
jgi:lipopolysaccharide export system permease protein